MNTHEPCPRMEALSAFTDKALREPERLELEAHVAGCAICTPVLDELLQLRARFAALPAVTPDFDVAAEVDRRIGALTAPAPRRSPRTPRTRWWQAALLAPGGAIAVTIGLWLGAALMPASLVASASVSAVQMAAFATLPPGALCPAPDVCGGPTR